MKIQKVGTEASKSQKKFGEASRKLVKAIKFSKTLVQAEKVSISHEIQEQSSKLVKCMAIFLYLLCFYLILRLFYHFYGFLCFLQL